jgi:hypothetical protein
MVVTGVGADSRQQVLPPTHGGKDEDFTREIKVLQWVQMAPKH